MGPTNRESPRFDPDPTSPRPQAPFIRSPGGAQNNSPIHVSTPPDGGGSGYSVHQQIRVNYKTAECIFSGEGISENEMAIFLQYEADAAMNSLTEEQKLEFAAVILRGDALQFYDEQVRQKAISYEE